jgi:hypothetical protein
MQYHIDRDETDRPTDLVPAWKKQTEHIATVNTLIINEQLIFIGGLDKKGKGAIEIWDRIIVAVSSHSAS